MAIELTSSAFDSGEPLPMRHTCDGNGISPPLHWRFAPDNTESLVLVCEDPDAPRGTFAHWVLYDIPPEMRELPENVPGEARLAWGGVHGRNDSGGIGYASPCPPSGPAHRYYFRIYALDQKLNLAPGANRQQILDQMDGHILDRGELLGQYARL